MTNLGSEQNPLRVAVIGAGPSGFYAVDQLFRKKELTVTVALFEALPTPYGLLRAGVAPDHQQMKSVSKYFERMVDKNSERFHYYGNVEIGKDMSIEELQNHYDAVIFSYGCSADRLTGLPGESKKNIHSAREFVAWYNGHPDYQNFEFDLSQESVAIIGQGNVAVDVARIIAKTPEELKNTDIPEHVLKKLAENKVKNIYMIGRRSPVQVAFTELEIKELGKLEKASVIIAKEDMDLTEANRLELEDEKNDKAKKNFKVLETYLQEEEKKETKIILKFFSNPVEFQGQDKVEALRCEKVKLSGEPFKQRIEKTNEHIDIPAGLVFRSIGYKGTAIKGLPFDEKNGRVPNQKGQITSLDGKPLAGLYTSGWIKRGPSGVIGTNKPCSTETVETLLSQINELPQAGAREENKVVNLLKSKNIDIINFQDWRKIENYENNKGASLGKPREKILNRDEALNIIKKDTV